MSLVEKPHGFCIISKQIVTSPEKIENKLPWAQTIDWLIDWWTIDIFLVTMVMKSTDRKTPNEVKPAATTQQMTDQIELNRFGFVTHTLYLSPFISPSFYLMDSKCFVNTSIFVRKKIWNES